MNRKIINFDNLDTIRCVRWNSIGDLLASGSDDNTATITDFGTGKVIHTERTRDESKVFQLFFFHSLGIARICDVCMLSLDRRENRSYDKENSERMKFFE